MPITDKKITITEYECNRCKHRFFPLVDIDGSIIKPKRCRWRACSSPYWDSPRQRKIKPKEQVVINR